MPALKPKACGLDLADTNASAAERADQKCWSRGECVDSVCLCDPGFGGPTCCEGIVKGARSSLHTPANGRLSKSAAVAATTGTFDEYQAFNKKVKAPQHTH